MKLSIIQYIQQTHGGDFVLIPGDVNVGHWDTPSFVSKFHKTFGHNNNINKNNYTTSQIVQQAGINCYTSMKHLFQQGGYDTIHMAVGDHELGDNPWLASTHHTQLIQEYRHAFQQVMNRHPRTKEFIYSTPIGTVPSRPIGTLFENTSYAYRHKNILLITIDVFAFTTSSSDNYINRTTGCGGDGVIIGAVQDTHLPWFESILQQAREDTTIKHVLVQGHLPILQPVRKINSSTMSICRSEESEFFQMMQKYHVDIYFAGEVHTNTVLQDTTTPSSNLIQVVSRGNGFNNFIVVHVTDTQINMTLYNEVGTKAKYNQQYEWFGSLSIDKTPPMEGQEYQPQEQEYHPPRIESKGQLEIVNIQHPLLYFDFEEIIPLGQRVVLGLDHDWAHKTLVQREMTIREVTCTHAMINHGSFGREWNYIYIHIFILD